MDKGIEYKRIIEEIVKETKITPDNIDDLLDIVDEDRKFMELSIVDNELCVGNKYHKHKRMYPFPVWVYEGLELGEEIHYGGVIITSSRKDLGLDGFIKQ